MCEHSNIAHVWPYPPPPWQNNPPLNWAQANEHVMQGAHCSNTLPSIDFQLEFLTLETSQEEAGNFAFVSEFLKAAAWKMYRDICHSVISLKDIDFEVTCVSGMFAIRAERDYVIEEDFMKAARKVSDNKKLESKLDYKPV